MANNAETTAGRPALLMTRPIAAAKQFVARLDAPLLADVQIVYSPLLEIVPNDWDADLATYHGAIFTSATAVALAGDGNSQAAYCVGARTAEAAKAAGWMVQIVAENADALVSMVAVGEISGPLLHLAGAHRRGEIAERLTRSGIKTDVCTIYNQELLSLSDRAQALFSAKNPVLVPLFSPRTAMQFASSVDQAPDLHIVAISQAVADQLSTLAPKELHVVAAPTSSAMVESVESFLRRASLA